MIVAITGGTGVVGRKLAERHAAAGDAVRVLSRGEAPAPAPAVEMHRGDLGPERAGLARFVDGADVLYHCAAETRDAGRMVEVNVVGTRNLVAAAQGRIGRWVQLGSIATYGAPQAGVIDEETPAQPVDLYGRSKTEADALVLEAAARGDFGCTVLRPAKVFGAGSGSANNDILYRLISLIDRGFFFFIGRPGAQTHYVHLDNLIDALEQCSRAAPGASRVYNLSDDCPIEVFVAAIAGALGKPAPALRLPEAPVRWLARVLGLIPGFPLDARRIAALTNRASFPADRIQGELGYVHRVRMEDGLRALVGEWRRRA